MAHKKYTAEFVLSELKDFMDILRGNEDIFYIGDLFEQKPYSIQRFSEWAREYSEHSEIAELIKKVKEVCAGRIAKGVMKNKLNAAGGIFTLKHHHKWTDAKQIDITGNISVEDKLRQLAGNNR